MGLRHKTLELLDCLASSYFLLAFLLGVSTIFLLLNNPMNGFFKKKTFFEKSTPYETVTTAMKSTQNLSPGRFRHAEAESEVKNLQIFHPDVEMKENDL